MNATMTDQDWIDLLIVELRMRRVPGPVIGDAVASVWEFIADSGQGAEEAFGSAREYAASLELPTRGAGCQALRMLFLPAMGLLAFLAFALASSAWFDRSPVLLSVPQAVLMAVPVLLVVLFSFPFYARAVFRKRWLLAVLALGIAATSATAKLVAPEAEAEAWLVLSPLAILVTSGAAIVILAITGTIATLRGGDEDEVVDPLEAQGVPANGRKKKSFPLFVNWIFVFFAIGIFGISWIASLATA
ncbi:hypothetical protein [Leucobacter chinensis]|uniref:hypothetical protein n=1 Tax=Leucobacter chinensis TaxID=2851010 RepID=UPI001C23866B|nr:hypothetical protein [Leucobacter chinensis]